MQTSDIVQTGSEFFKSGTEAFKSGTDVLKNVISNIVNPSEDVAPNAIDLLKSQHREVDALFAEIQGSGQRAAKRKESLFALLNSKLTMHAQIEEKIFYPASKPVDKDKILEAVEEHSNLKAMLRKLSSTSASDETFDAKIKVLKEIVQHHVKEEENSLFPEIESEFSKDQLQELGAKMQRMMDRGTSSKPKKSNKTASKKSSNRRLAHN